MHPCSCDGGAEATQPCASPPLSPVSQIKKLYRYWDINSAGITPYHRFQDPDPDLDAAITACSSCLTTADQVPSEKEQSKQPDHSDSEESDQGSPRPDSPVIEILQLQLPVTMAPQAVNELLSSQKSSDSLQIALHPLPILEISDHITRGYQRGHKGAIVGALMGQQNGRQITIEHSFTFGATKGEDGTYHTDPESFIARLDQMRDVHKAPPLDIVGWYALVPKTGPTSDHLPIHNEILERYNESAILLGFHIEDVLRPVPGNPMPITIYESVFEAEDTSKEVHTEGEDKEMKDLDVAPKMVLRFRELTYGTETGEAEMIAMQDIREGVAFSTRSTRNGDSKTTTLDIKGKGKAPATSQAAGDEDANLTKDELEQISALQTKANATKMMLDRINLLVAYLEQLPPDFVSGTEYPGPGGAAQPPTGEHSTPSAKILRQIQALVTNIELVTPAQQEALEEEMLQEANDVKVVELMADLMASISAMREVGKKFAVVEASKQKARLPERQYEYGIGGGSSQQAALGNVGDIAM